MDAESVDAARVSRSRTWIAYAVLLVSAGAILVLVTEIALRVAGISYPRTSDRDPNRGTARKPGIEWWQKEEGEAYIRINQAGFRDAERVEGDVAGTFRIAVLGDSMVEALQVPVEQRFTEVMENLLERQRCLGPDRVEVLNFGVSGDGTAQQLMILRHHVWQYQPDMVVLGVMTGNDIRNNSKQLQNDDGRPYFVLRNGELVLDDSFRRSDAHVKTWQERLGYWFIDRSRLAQLAYEARATLQKRRAINRARADFGDADVDVGLDTLVYREPATRAWKDAWEVTEALLTQMHSEVQQHGAQFLAATLSNTVQVNPDATVRQQLIDKLGVNALSYPDDRIKELGQRAGFQVLNLVPPMLEYVNAHGGVYLHGFANTPKGTGHWNETGHRVVAQLLSDALCARFAQPRGLQQQAAR